MTKSLFTGAEFFDELIRGNGYYVDKTEMIYELVKETTNKVTLFTRPRRFGKTLTMTIVSIIRSAEFLFRRAFLLVAKTVLWAKVVFN